MVDGPAGMSAAGTMVSWTPRPGQVGYVPFTLEAVDPAGGTSRRSFGVYVNEPAFLPPAPGNGLTVTPATVRARRPALLTIRGQSFDRGTRVLAGGTRLSGARVEDASTLTVRVSCLKPGAQTITIRRRNGTTESLARALTVTGPRCRSRAPRSRR